MRRQGHVGKIKGNKESAEGKRRGVWGRKGEEHMEKKGCAGKMEGYKRK